ncbi:hypothetical protein [Ruminococcus sp.]|uniref:hypothetical protein n=1 Tax=Ruminococcus sp. TaxID=41978 RepID=UPI001B420622|nr:hypothetical protein [Ruminococcus sp.]MBP5432318.1 AAA family ATPase [Ruminococcus sp.]
MGIPVLLLGESGSGKSASLRNFSPDEAGILNVAGKPLPFRKQMKVINEAGYPEIFNTLSRHTLKRYVIDDSQYLLCFERFNRARETGYQKFTDMAVNFYTMIQTIIKKTPADCIVYILHHTETTADGRLKAKTIGKMLDEKLTIEGLFSIVLLAEVDESGYHFRTNGEPPIKSPMEMFSETVIDNDLKAVDDTIRAYYNLNTVKE